MKIYALYHTDKLIYSKPKYELKITSAKHWINQIQLLTDSNEKVVYYNECIFLSFSRAELVKKAKELKEQWIAEQENVLETIKKYYNSIRRDKLCLILNLY